MYAEDKGLASFKHNIKSPRQRPRHAPKLIKDLVLELPIPTRHKVMRKDLGDEKQNIKSQRGVIIINMFGADDDGDSTIIAGQF